MWILWIPWKSRRRRECSRGHGRLDLYRRATLHSDEDEDDDEDEEEEVGGACVDEDTRHAGVQRGSGRHES